MKKFLNIFETKAIYLYKDTIIFLSYKQKLNKINQDLGYQLYNRTEIK